MIALSLHALVLCVLIDRPPRRINFRTPGMQAVQARVLVLPPQSLHHKTIHRASKVKTSSYRSTLRGHRLIRSTSKKSRRNNTAKVKSKAQALKLQEMDLASQIVEDERMLGQSMSAIQQALYGQYQRSILARIQQRWIVPDAALSQSPCTLDIRLSQEGDVLSVHVKISSGNAIVDRSALLAVRNASPLPMPADPRINENFRQIELVLVPYE